MGTITVVPDAASGFVRVEVNWQDIAHNRRVWIFRKVANQPDTTRIVLRDGDMAWLSNGIAVAFDHEMPLDTPVQYSSFLPLNWNGDFEDGVTEWQDATNDGSVGTVTQSMDFYAPNTGNASLQLQPSGAVTSKAVSEFVPATPLSVTYTVTGRLMVSDYWTGGIGLQVQFYNGVTPTGSIGFLDDFSPYPGDWNYYTLTGFAPATTTQMRVVVGITGSPPATMRLYADEVYISSAASTITATPVMIPSNGGGWWTDPLRPWTKVPLVIDLGYPGGCAADGGIAYIGVSGEEFPADSQVNEVNDSAYPVSSWNRRKSGRQDMVVAMESPADVARLRLLHASGAPLLFSFSQEYREAPSYGQHDDVTIDRISNDQRVTWRVSKSAFVKVEAPPGPAEGTLRTRFADITRYDTFADGLAARGGAYDTFDRVVAAGGWGSTPPTGGGPAYAYTVAPTAAEFSVSLGVGQVAIGALTTIRRATLAAISLATVDLRVATETIAVLSGSGGVAELELRGRFVDTANFVGIKLQRVVTSNVVRVAVRQVVAGGETITSYVNIPFADASASVTLRLVASGTTLQGWGWITGSPMPATPTVTLTGVTMLSAGAVELASALSASITNTLPFVVRWDSLVVANLANNGAVTWLDVLQGEAAL